MVSVEQSAANAKTAAAVVARSLGYYNNDGSGFHVADLTADQQLKLANALCQYVVAHPSLFTDQALAVAQGRIAQSDYGQPLSDPSFSYDDFADATINNVIAAGAQVAAIGTGTLAAVQTVGNLIPLIALFALGVFLFAFMRKTIPPKRVV